MGFLANSVSLSHYKVKGDLPKDIRSWALHRLLGRKFNPIDDSNEEVSVGWVHLDDPKSSDFTSPDACWREQYLIFSLRKDQRKVPAAALKAHFEKEKEKYLGETGLKRLPKQKKEDLMEAVKAKLLAQSLPIPTVVDAIWDTNTGMVTFCSLSPKVIELFEDMFKKTFEGLRLSAFHPYARAESVLDDRGQELLRQANKAGGDNYLEMIKENQWLGADFMLWLMFKTMNDSAEYQVNQRGILDMEENFVAYVDDKVTLLGAGENGAQKVSVAGPQDRFNEVRIALLNNKKITEATLHLECGDDSWKMTLKGEMFHFASLKSPAVKIEKDDSTDEQMEREAVFFERTVLVDKATQLFNSLFATFLEQRLGSSWASEEEAIQKWLNVCSLCGGPL